MKKKYVFIAMMTFLIATFFAACAEEMVQVSAGGDDSGDLASFYSAAAADKLYLCESEIGTDSVCVLSPDGTLVKSDSHKALGDDGDGSRYLSPMALVSDTERVYVISRTVRQAGDDVAYEGAGLYALGAAGETGERICTLDLSLTEDGSPDAFSCLSAIMRDGYLHLLFDDGENAFDESESGQLLLSIELSGGKRAIHKTTGAMQLIDANETEVLYAQAAAEPTETVLQAIDMASGETREVNRLNGKADRPRNIVYDQARNSAFYSVVNQIWGIREIGRDARMIGLLPTRSLSGLYYAGEDQLYAYDSKTAFVLSVDWSAEIEAQTLVIAGNSSYAEEYARLHPELEIQSAEGEDREVIDAVLTQSGPPDLFILDTDSPVFAALKARGYLAPLNDAEIVQCAQGLHSDIQGALYSSGALCAIPISIEFQPMLGVNRELWERLNLGEVPQSWPALLDFVKDWCNSPNASSEIRLMAGDARTGFVRRLTADYEAYRAKQADMGYDTEVFRNLMAQVDGVPWENLDNPADAGEDALLQYDYWLMLEGDSSTYSPLPLSIEESGTPIITARLSVAAVNPYSRHADIAMDYLKYVVENMDTVTQMELRPAMNEPLEADNYAEILEMYTSKMEDIERRISAETDEAERRALEWERQDAQAELQRAMEDPWSVSPEAIARFRQASQRISLTNEAELDEDTLDALQTCQRRLACGEMSADEFIAEIDRRIVMQAREGA